MERRLEGWRGARSRRATRFPPCSKGRLAIRGSPLTKRPAQLDPSDFIRTHLRLTPVPGLADIRLYTAHPGSGLSRLARPPYWAHPWAGGLVLARHIRERPETVTGLRVLDLGAGSGVVAIAAAKAGAKAVIAAEIDPHGVAALALNAEANGVILTVVGDDLTGGPPPGVDLVLVGDLFYDPVLAERVTAFLDRCLAAGAQVLIGDPGRAHLPQARLRRLADYGVPDFGDGVGAATPSAVFAFRPAPDDPEADAPSK
jgi:predicted nicotinamide N-methyase